MTEPFVISHHLTAEALDGHLKANANKKKILHVRKMDCSGIPNADMDFTQSVAAYAHQTVLMV